MTDKGDHGGQKLSLYDMELDFLKNVSVDFDKAAVDMAQKVRASQHAVRKKHDSDQKAIATKRREATRKLRDILLQRDGIHVTANV